MNVFEAARRVSAVDAAEKLGIPYRRSGLRGTCRCLFHDDRTPSMALYPDGGYHCFGCGAHGDVTALYMKALGLGAMEAAKRVCEDFGLSYDHQPSGERRPDVRLLRKTLTDFRQREMKKLMAERDWLTVRMTAREEAMYREEIPFDEWWDDREWADIQQKKIHAEEELMQLEAMDMKELWEMYKGSAGMMQQRRTANDKRME